jgi:hypothetical protein
MLTGQRALSDAPTIAIVRACNSGAGERNINLPTLKFYRLFVAMISAPSSLVNAGAQIDQQLRQV